MKKTIIILPMFILALVAIYNSHAKRTALAAKDVTVAIYSNNNYSSAAYNDAKASVEVKLIKISGKKQTVLCSEKYTDMQLKNIPAAGNAINSKLDLPAFISGKDKLVISYTIEYNSNGSIMTFCNEVPQGNTHTSQLQIVI